jgi:hypothetical protein
MNAAACQQALEGVGAGVAASLRAVDCVANGVTTQAFGRLFAPGGSLVPVLTILLTLYVAFFAISLLLGRSRLGVRSLTPRMITLGLVLTFATSWLAYQSVVWNLAIGGPDWPRCSPTSSTWSSPRSSRRARGSRAMSPPSRPQGSCGWARCCCCSARWACW